jgi:hypothetical protein
VKYDEMSNVFSTQQLTQEQSNNRSPSKLRSQYSHTSKQEKKDSIFQFLDQLTSKETKQVNRSKVLLLGVMAISAVVLGLLTFLIVDEDEEDDFRAAVSSK